MEVQVFTKTSSLKPATDNRFFARRCVRSRLRNNLRITQIHFGGDIGPTPAGKRPNFEGRIQTMSPIRWLVCIAAMAVFAIAGCNDVASPLGGTNGSDDLFSLAQKPFPPSQTPPPPGLETVTMGSESLTFWPYTGENFSGDGQDPINIIFFGKADPRSIRAALLSVDGDRTGFGWSDEPPFNSVWQDAIGNIQTGYGSSEGWTGGAIQLACGDYHVARFHLRLFRLGDWTVGNAHFEVLIPNTSDHQVVSWEFAEQFVITDMMRSGLLDGDVPMMATAAINPSPFGTIPAIIYNGLPVPLRVAIGGPPEDQENDVPIGTDGSATVFNVSESVPWEPGTATEEAVSVYDQVIPKPFCAVSEPEYVHVAGPVMLHQVNEMTAEGEFISTFRAEGELYITPVNPLTGEVIGETRRAIVREHHDAYVSDAAVRASSSQHQIILPPSTEGGGKFLMRLKVSTKGANGYQVLVQCGENPAAGTSAPHRVPMTDGHMK
jgi:hypothetical protein